jgi:hypothetical protein
MALASRPGPTAEARRSALINEAFNPPPSAFIGGKTDFHFSASSLFPMVDFQPFPLSPNGLSITHKSVSY